MMWMKTETISRMMAKSQPMNQTSIALTGFLRFLPPPGVRDLTGRVDRDGRVVDVVVADAGRAVPVGLRAAVIARVSISFITKAARLRGLRAFAASQTCCSGSQFV
jgi:hypothetical protein